MQVNLLPDEADVHISVGAFPAAKDAKAGRTWTLRQKSLSLVSYDNGILYSRIQRREVYDV